MEYFVVLLIMLLVTLQLQLLVRVISTAGPYNSNTAAALTQGSYTWDATTIATTGLPISCSQTVTGDTVHVLTVNPAPDASFASATLTVCEGDTDSLSSSKRNKCRIKR